MMKHASVNPWRSRCGIRLTASALLWEVFLVCMVMHGPPPMAAVAADLSLPGAVQVHVQPPEAVAHGAQWSLDGGPLQHSGSVVANVHAGNHDLGFVDLPEWEEPAKATVLAIGGRQTTLTVSYRPLPRFYLLEIPDQHVRGNTTLEFMVETEREDDPSSPGPGAVLQFTATPPPAGPVILDAATRRFSYTPAPNDRLPFVVQIMAGDAGLAHRFEITPLPERLQEAAVIEYDRPLPDPESRDYMQITETSNGMEVFNDGEVETFTVSISGPTLVFAAEHPAHLHRQFNGRLNLREMRLYADTVIVRSPLVLPQTEVLIHARELRFERDGRFETTPRPRLRQPEGATWENQFFAGRNGDPGHAGGNVSVFVERFHSDSTTQDRFVLLGGGGGPAGAGRHGFSESQFPFLSADWRTLMGRADNPVCGTTLNSEVMLYFEDRFNNQVQDICGSKVTARGENAVAAGFPGLGGSGGRLRSTLNLASFARQEGGAAGARGGDYVGGTLSARRFIYRVQNTRIDRFGDETVTISDTTAAKAAGQNALAPAGAAGGRGVVEVVQEPGAWLHSFAVRSVLNYAKDAYLNGRIAETRQLLGQYGQLLQAYELVIESEEPLEDGVFAELANLDQLQIEVENILHRIDSNLDYFGNPAGWVPMLSFEANLIAFQNEVDQSIPVLYLSYWLNHAATNLQASLAATEQIKGHLLEERDRMEASFNEAQLVVPRLQTEAQNLAFRIGTLRGRIALKLAELEERARNNVAERNRLPFWKKALGVLSVAADLVPVGQPTVGRIGSGLGLLSQVDPDDPLESAQKLAPQAFGVMTNKNITLCFGTNAPPAVSTNSASSTNEVKKARQDNLKRMTECAKFLGSELKEVAAVFKEAQVDDKELAAELEKLKASDVELQALTLEVETLSADKERFAQELARALQILATFSSDLAENLVATHELENRIAINLNALDHGALMHVKEMERRAKDRLVRYQYLLAKSFQYRQLKPYSGNLQLTRLLERFQQLVETSTSHLLTAQEFQSLQGIFIGELRELVALSLDNVNAPGRSFPKSYRLDSEQLLALNVEGRVVLNLKDLGLLDATDENIRLAELRTLKLEARPLGPVGSLALVRVNFEHGGQSRLTAGGRTFLFRHYQTEDTLPIVWNAIYDANTGQLVNSTLSAAQQSLISVLLAQQPVPVTNVVFFTQPAADAEIILTKQVATANGTDFVIDDLLFEIQYDFHQTGGNLREMDVQVTGDLAPIIAVSQADINQRRDGQGDFRRIYPAFSLVTLQAPPTYGQYVFDRWVVNNQPQTTQVPAVAVFLTANSKVEARYRLPAGLLLLTVIPAPPGQVGFKFLSEPGVRYTVEQSSNLASPIWRPVESRDGDGSHMVITRPQTEGSGFFRLRLGM